MKVNTETTKLLKIPFGLLIKVQRFSITTVQIESETDPTTFIDDPKSSADPTIFKRAIEASMMYFFAIYFPNAFWVVY